MEIKGDLVQPNSTIGADGHIATPNLTVGVDGGITSAGMNVTAVGVMSGVTRINLPPAAKFYAGIFTIDPIGLVSGDAGLFWFNSTSLQFKGWDGSSIQILGAANAGPQWSKYTFLYTDLAVGSGGAFTNSVFMFNLPPGGIIHATKIKHSESFTGGGVTGYVVSVGISTAVIKYANAFDVFQAIGSKVAQYSPNEGIEDQVSQTQILITSTSTGANLNSAQHGSVDVWVLASAAV